MGTNEQAVRQAILDLALNSHANDLTHEAVAARAQVPVNDVYECGPNFESLIAFTVQPLAASVDSHLRHLPIHTNPTPAQQREVLGALLDGAMDYPREQALVLRIITSDNSSLTGRADEFAYHAGVRLLGINYNADADATTRVYFVTEMISLAVATHRDEFADPHKRGVLLDSLVAVLNPANQPPQHSGLRRRWNDPKGQTSPGDPQRRLTTQRVEF